MSRIGALPGARDRGSATAETAMVLPVLIALLLVGVTAVAAMADKLGCIHKARDVALAAARGAQTSGHSVTVDADSVTATVKTRFTTCVSVAPREP